MGRKTKVEYDKQLYLTSKLPTMTRTSIRTLTCEFSAEFLPESRSRQDEESKSTFSTAIVRFNLTRLLVVDPVALSLTTSDTVSSQMFRVHG